ncbi:MAG TPA: glycosyltransferase family 4 protein [Bryobacteraceae bacterium]|jgi:glycosyltransferase involved in cell wall biosynthesis|nr:glycosyltransferase family 4 protein [Bryobacteraceae bacterium]
MAWPEYYGLLEIPMNDSHAGRNVRVLFASASRALSDETLQRFYELDPDADLFVVSEFPPAHGQWIRYHLRRSFWLNFSQIRARLKGKRIRFAAIILEPRSPFQRLRLLSLLVPARDRIAYNENGDFFQLSRHNPDPLRSHLLWRLRNWRAARRQVAFEKHAQNGLGNERATPRAGEFLYGLAARIRALCAFCAREMKDRVVPVPQSARFSGAQSSSGDVVIVASPYIPFPLAHGGAVRMFNLMQRGARDFTQVLICFVDSLPEAIPKELEQICAEVLLVERQGSHLHASRARPEVVEEFDSVEFRRVLRDAVQRWRPAIVQLEFTQMAQYARDCGSAKTILVEHDVTFDLYRQLQERQPDWETAYQLKLWERFERRAWKQVDHVVVMSKRDQEIAGARNVIVLPNGVDVARFTPTDEAEESGRLLFVGSFNHLPNIVALEWFIRDVWPLVRHPKRLLHIIAGARHEYFLELYQKRLPLSAPGISVEGFVADVKPAYARSSVVVVPLKVGAGTCIKVLEAMAMAKPVVSSPIGLQGLDLHPGREAIETQSAGEMAIAIDLLLADEGERRRLGEAARRRIESTYSWDAIATQQIALYRSKIVP